MKLTVQHVHLRSTHALDSRVENQLIALQEQLVIDEAQVRLEYRHTQSPPYCIHIHLVTPGPDVIAEGADHTLQAAIAKVFAALRAKIEARSRKRARRGLSSVREPSVRRVLLRAR